MPGHCLMSGVESHILKEHCLSNTSPLLLNRFFNKFKVENLVSSFGGSGIYPLNEPEVLKMMMKK